MIRPTKIRTTTTIINTIAHVGNFPPSSSKFSTLAHFPESTGNNINYLPVEEIPYSDFFFLMVKYFVIYSIEP